MNGLASEEHLPAMTEDTSANIADLIEAIKAEPDLPLSQIKRERMSFVSEQEDMDTFDESLDESDDRSTSWPPGSTPKSKPSSNLMDWLSHRSPTVSQSGAMEMNSAKKHVKLPMHTCKVCDRVFYSGENNLTLKHVRNAHKGDLELVIDQKAANWAALNDHLAKYFPDASVKEEQTPEQKGAVQCIECHEWITNKMVPLKLHVNTKHLHFALYHCRPCNIDFYGSLKQIRLHVNKHHNGQEDVIDNSQIEVNWNRLNSRISHFFPTFRAEHFKTRSKTLTKIRLKRLQAAKAKLDTAPSKNSAKAQKKASDPVMTISEPYRQQIFMDRKMKQKKLNCSDCKETVSRKPDYTLLNHVNLKHLRFPVFQCTACQMTFYDYSGGTAKKHANLHHDGDTSAIQDNRPEHYEEIQQKCVQVFGPKMNTIPNTN
ncbi:hypothetical protein Ddc_13805 [Ditylenchus destructor]|nr:hypothetical protein Ddc_13805 [Ditylenchus destructor]